MRVLQLTQRFPPALGGVENHVLNVSSKLLEAGFGVEVYATDLLRDVPFQRISGESQSFPFRVKRFPALKVLELPHGLGIIAPSMIPAAANSRADLIHAHAYGYFPTHVGSLVRLTRKIPLVITTHSDPGRASLRKSLFDAIIPLLTLRRAHRVIALTEVEANYLRRLGVPRGRIIVIPNGIDPSEFAHIQPKKSRAEKPTILYVGRVYAQQKGLDTLLRALRLLTLRTDAELKIAGEDWGGTAQLRGLAKQLGVHERITITGRLTRDRLIEMYTHADVFVLPSLFEPFGIVLLEAMAAALPVVASRVGGIVEVVQDGVTGQLVQPGDPKALADALDSLLTHDSARVEMGENGRRRAAEFSWNRIIPRLLQVYSEVLQERA